MTQHDRLVLIGNMVTKVPIPLYRVQVFYSEPTTPQEREQGFVGEKVHRSFYLDGLTLEQLKEFKLLIAVYGIEGDVSATLFQ